MLLRSIICFFKLTTKNKTRNNKIYYFILYARWPAVTLYTHFYTPKLFAIYANGQFGLTIHGPFVNYSNNMDDEEYAIGCCSGDFNGQIIFHVFPFYFLSIIHFLLFKFELFMFSLETCVYHHCYPAVINCFILLYWYLHIKFYRI